MIRLIINTPPTGVAYTFTGIFLQGASRMQGNNSLLSTKRLFNEGRVESFQSAPYLRAEAQSVIRPWWTSGGLGGGNANYRSDVHKSSTCSSDVMAKMGTPPYR